MNKVSFLLREGHLRGARILVVCLNKIRFCNICIVKLLKLKFFNTVADSAAKHCKSKNKADYSVNKIVKEGYVLLNAVVNKLEI